MKIKKLILAFVLFFSMGLVFAGSHGDDAMALYIKNPYGISIDMVLTCDGREIRRFTVARKGSTLVGLPRSSERCVVEAIGWDFW